MREDVRDRLLESVRVILVRYDQRELTLEAMNDKINDVLYLMADMIASSKAQKDRADE